MCNTNPDRFEALQKELGRDLPPEEFSLLSPNEILRILLVCAGHKFITAAGREQFSVVPPSHDLFTAAAAAQPGDHELEMKQGWLREDMLLGLNEVQQQWDGPHGAPIHPRPTDATTHSPATIWDRDVGFVFYKGHT